MRMIVTVTAIWHNVSKSHVHIWNCDSFQWLVQQQHLNLNHKNWMVFCSWHLTIEKCVWTVIKQEKRFHVFRQISIIKSGERKKLIYFTESEKMSSIFWILLISVLLPVWTFLHNIRCVYLTQAASQKAL